MQPFNKLMKDLDISFDRNKELQKIINKSKNRIVYEKYEIYESKMNYDSKK